MRLKFVAVPLGFNLKSVRNYIPVLVVREEKLTSAMQRAAWLWLFHISQHKVPDTRLIQETLQDIVVGIGIEGGKLLAAVALAPIVGG